MEFIEEPITSKVFKILHQDMAGSGPSWVLRTLYEIKHTVIEFRQFK